MEKSLEDIGIQVVRTSVPKTCARPDCGVEQSVVGNCEHIRKIKDPSLEKPTLLLVHRISVKCINHNCPKKSFVLPAPGIERYQRVTRRVKEMALNKNILNNIPYYRTACSFNPPHSVNVGTSCRYSGERRGRGFRNRGEALLAAWPR
jgi:hypothetical protein